MGNTRDVQNGIQTADLTSFSPVLEQKKNVIVLQKSLTPPHTRTGMRVMVV